jgi:outer membrane receptor for ferrienterochelin and colicins
MLSRRPLIRIFIGLMVSLSSLLICGSAGAGAASLPTDLTELPIETLMNIPVYGASKYEQKLMEAPAYVTIINQDAIKKYGYRTLADTLRSVPGLFITNDHNYQYLGVRGFNRPGDYSTRILLLVDGHRINDGLYDQAPIGTDFPIDIDLIDRVEVIRGPSSSIYGTNAFLAVVNVITRNGRDLKSNDKKGLEASGDAGSFNSYKGRLSYGNQWAGGPELLVSGSYYDSRGPDFFFRQVDNPAARNEVAHNCDYDNFLSLFSKFAFQDFTLTGVYHSREKGIPTGAYGTVFGDPRTRTVDTRTFVNLKYDHTFASEWRVLARMSYNHNPYDGFYFINKANPGEPFAIVENRDIGRADWWGTEVQVSKTLFDRHKVILGNEYRDYFRLDQRNYDENPKATYLDDQRESRVWAFYAQDEFTILSNLRLNAGLRYDHYSTFGGSLNPRLALIYNPFKQTALKLLYGQAFRAPNAYELYYQDGGITQKPNPDLKPEKINTYEAVWEQYFAQHYRFVASGYYYKIHDLITQQMDPTDGLIIFENTDRVVAKGLTLELGGKWANGLEGRLSYTLGTAKNEQTGKLLTNSPTHLPKFNLIVPLFSDKLFSGLEVIYLSSRKGLNNSRVGDVILTNLTLFNKNLFKGWEFSASAYNIANQKFRDPGAQEHLINGMNGIIQDGIAFRVKLTYSY